MPRKSAPLREGWHKQLREDAEGTRHTVYRSPQGLEYSPAEYRELAAGEYGATETLAQPLPEAPRPDSRPLDSLKQSTDPRATADQISQSLVYVLLIVTGVAGFIARDESLVLDESEAADMAIPAGNILSGSQLNRRYGKYLRDSGDYTALGYAACRYLLRVATEVRTRLDQQKAVQVTVQPTGVPYAAAQSQQTPHDAAGGAPPSDQRRASPFGPGAYQATPLGGYRAVAGSSATPLANAAGSWNGVPADHAVPPHG